MIDCRIREITPADNAALGALIRYNLKKHGLDIPGTVYFDRNINYLGEYYLAKPKERCYLVAENTSGQMVGGIGLAEFDPIPGCGELQKLYLAEEVKGNGLSYHLIDLIEEKARQFGYQRLYLETHSNLPAAIHIYQKCGYPLIPRPDFVQHGTMDHFFLKEL